MSQVRALTEAEKNKPYSKFYMQEVAIPNPDLIKILKQGAMDPQKALKPEDRHKLLDPGYHDVETGYCQMPNGTAYVAVNNVFPGVTLDMVKWWFVWHSIEDLRYMIWFPKGHFGIQVSDEDRKIVEDQSKSMEERIFGITHHVVEDTGCGSEDIAISFLSPEDLGLDSQAYEKSPVQFIVGANGVSVSHETGIKAPAIMMHTVREIEGGVEFRSRFWMGYHIVNGEPVKLLPDGVTIPEVVPMGLAHHNVEEYSNLAKILPELYKEFKDTI